MGKLAVPEPCTGREGGRRQAGFCCSKRLGLVSGWQRVGSTVPSWQGIFWGGQGPVAPRLSPGGEASWPRGAGAPKRGAGSRCYSATWKSRDNRGRRDNRWAQDSPGSARFWGQAAARPGHARSCQRYCSGERDTWVAFVGAGRASPPVGRADSPATTTVANFSFQLALRCLEKELVQLPTQQASACLSWALFSLPLPIWRCCQLFFWCPFGPPPTPLRAAHAARKEGKCMCVCVCVPSPRFLCNTCATKGAGAGARK